ncbi:UNVERIFIED_CONTAM: hypothetical protein GTU68_037721 [Idotea baltica]|nr:hypothetical protein [Idotea baltica]
MDTRRRLCLRSYRGRRLYRCPGGEALALPQANRSGSHPSLDRHQEKAQFTCHDRRCRHRRDGTSGTLFLFRCADLDGRIHWNHCRCRRIGPSESRCGPAGGHWIRDHGGQCPSVFPSGGCLYRRFQPQKGGKMGPACGQRAGHPTGRGSEATGERSLIKGNSLPGPTADGKSGQHSYCDSNNPTSWYCSKWPWSSGVCCCGRIHFGKFPPSRGCGGESLFRNGC